MEKSTVDVLNSVFENAKKYEMENGNCAQCVIAAVFETFSIKNDDAFRAASGFADGVGLTGDGHCGALSGGTIAISYLFGRKKEDFNKRGKMIKSLILSKKLYDGFIEKYGTCRCADIQKKLVGRSFNFYDPAETEAAIKAGLPDKCSTLTAEAARLTAKIILEQWERESQKEKERKS